MMRRLVSAAFAALLILAGLACTMPGIQEVRAGNADLDQFANVQLPPDLGQASIQVFFPQTSHTLRGYFLDYWRANGGAITYGYPISEPFPSADGFYSQAFQNGIFQFRLDLVWTEAPSVTLMPIGDFTLSERLDNFRRDGRRGDGGGDRRSSAWKPVEQDGATATRAWNEGGVWVEATGHTISGAFNDWYQAHEGPYYLGNPISQPLRERGLTVQYFDGAILTQDGDGNVQLAPLGQEISPQLGIDTSPVDGGGLPLYDDSMFLMAGNPNPRGDMAAPGKKWIEVNLSEQRLYAYQGSTLVSTSLVSTGVPPNETERGTFHIRYKLEKQDMAGTTNAAGEVVELGNEAANAARDGEVSGQTAYVVKDIPNVMYFDYDAEALHGAYWHNNFGNRMSHGCVNLPLDFAAFLFGWAPLGTMVWVHD